MKFLPQVLDKQGAVHRALGDEQTSDERLLSPRAGRLDPKGISTKICSVVFTALSRPVRGLREFEGMLWFYRSRLAAAMLSVTRGMTGPPCPEPQSPAWGQ